MIVTSTQQKHPGDSLPLERWSELGPFSFHRGNYPRISGSKSSVGGESVQGSCFIFLLLNGKAVAGSSDRTIPPRIRRHPARERPVSATSFHT
jgi:hypothetical protein